MARERMGRAEEARADLLAARELLENRLRSGMDRGRGTPVQGFWFDYAFARILLREAEGVVRVSGGG
jgi:hypothetical protein